MRSELLVFGSPSIGEREIEEVVATLRSGWLGTGPRTETFQRAFAEYVRAPHAVGVSSCTAGLHLALDGLGVGPGDEVITSPMTFGATANVIVHAGAQPVFVDVDRRTMNLDVERIEGAITERTRAIVPVHMAGRPCDMGAIMGIAGRHGLLVIEDAAHAVEAWHGDRKVGSIGDATVFSFYVTKNLVTGEGGMITTSRADLAEEMGIRALHGLSKDAWRRYSGGTTEHYEVVYPGYKYNMTDLQAALGIHQLARIEENLRVRERQWAMYDEAFSGLDEVVTPAEEEGITHARHLYTLLVRPETLTVDRDGFRRDLRERNIGTGIHFIALHLHRYYRERFGFRRGMFPDAEWISDRTLSLPLGPKFSDGDLQDVVDAVREVVAGHRRTAVASAELE